MLADGRIVIANHCQYTYLFRAIRGGGPRYGVVLGTTIKAHPNVDVITAHRLTIAPYQKTEKNTDLLDAVAVLLQSFPDLNEGGYDGYGYWYRNLRGFLVNNATSGYTHGIWAIGKPKDEAEATFAPAFFINETYITYNDYWSFYNGESAQYDPAGISWAITSRMITRDAVSDYTPVREAVEVLSGKPEEYVGNVVLIADVVRRAGVRGRQRPHLRPAPGVRTSPYVLATWRNPANNATNAERKAVNDDITFIYL
ncbi:MAG: hypothetical protein Q9177_004872 [Variospora cf. flavescens]